MSEGTATIILIGGMLVLLAAGAPIYAALLFPSLVVLFLMGGFPFIGALSNIAFFDSANFVLTAVPLFIFMAEVFFISGMATRVYDVASKWFGGLPGGLASGSIAACGGFAAISGSSTATAATIGLIAVPEMEKRGYNRRLIGGALAAGGTLGILIPPSIPMILYGSITGESVGRLFMAGFIPGIIITAMLMAYTSILCKLRPALAPRQFEATWGEKFRSLLDVWAPLLVAFAVLGSIYSGITTPTEAAGIGALATTVLAIVVFRQTELSRWVDAAVRTVQTTAWMITLVIGGLTFGYTLTLLSVPQRIVELIAASSVAPWMVIVMISVLLVIMGCMVDPMSMLLITLPILYPLVTQLGYNPVWFAVIFVINMELGNVTPPVGMNLFVMQGITNIPFVDIIRGVWGYIVVLTIGLIVMALFPELSLWLPNTMMGK